MDLTFSSQFPKECGNTEKLLHLASNSGNTNRINFVSMLDHDIDKEKSEAKTIEPSTSTGANNDNVHEG